MENQQLELRMYFFVPYNISEIQKSIQAGHAALEYALQFGQTEEFIDFAKNWKTWIILNGGTTNDQRDLNDTPIGTLNQIGDKLFENEIQFSFFREPDLNDALTAICLIVDERVFNKKDYPEFVDYILGVKLYPESKAAMDAQNVVSLKTKSLVELQELFPEYYKEWVRLVGGVKNVFLRELLKDKKKA